MAAVYTAYTREEVVLNKNMEQQDFEVERDYCIAFSSIQYSYILCASVRVYSLEMQHIIHKK